MKWLLFVLMMIIAILLVIAYSLMVMAHDADERAEEMYWAWKAQTELKQGTDCTEVEQTDCAWK